MDLVRPGRRPPASTRDTGQQRGTMRRDCVLSQDAPTVRTSEPRYHLRVAGHSNNNIGDLVCTSGANSGEHCSLRVTNDAVLWPCNGYTCSGSKAEPATATVAAVGGDSGGPVYSNRADGRVTARGITSAVSHAVPCPLTAVHPGYFSNTTYKKCGQKSTTIPLNPS